MDNYDYDSHNRRVVIEGSRALERSAASLARSNQVAVETEQIGYEVSYTFTAKFR